MYFLKDAFMLQGDELAPRTCAQRGPFSNRRWRFCSRARHVDAPQITCSSLRALVVFVLFYIAAVFSEW